MSEDQVEDQNNGAKKAKTKKPKVAVNPRELVPSIIIGVLLLGLVALLIFNFDTIWSLATQPEKIREWIEHTGPWAPIVYIFTQFIQIVIFVIPGEVTQLAGGFLFGIGLGSLYALIGAGLGSAFCFLIARRLGLSFVAKIFGPKNIAKFEIFISKPRAIIVFFFLFLIPGIPKDILCYIAGLSQLRLRVSLLISMIGRTPALVASMIIGDAAGRLDWAVIAIVGGIALVLFLLGLLFKDRVMKLLENLAHPGREAANTRKEG